MAQRMAGESPFYRVSASRLMSVTTVEARTFNGHLSFERGLLRIPEHPAGHSDNIRPPKPVYPATLV